MSLDMGGNVEVEVVLGRFSKLFFFIFFRKNTKGGRGGSKE